MKQFFYSLRFALLIAVILGGVSKAMAYDLEVDGIYYNFYGANACVVGVNSNYYSGTNSTDVVIPEMIANNGIIYPVTSINATAFKNVSWMISITIPNTITSIGEKAFYGCSNLTKVNISDIAAWCKIDFHFLVNGYRNYRIDDDGSDFYYGGNPLREAHHLYMNGEEIVNLVIPETVDSISFGAFYGCKGIRSVDTGSGVTYIAGQAFYMEPYLDENYEYIYGSLDELTIGENVKQMGSSYGYYYSKWEQWLFAGAFPSHVDRVTYKATSCESVGFYSYWGLGLLTSFEEIIIDEGVEVLPDAFSKNNDSLKIIYYNAKNCSYSSSPFGNCSNLNQIIIGSKVESIGGNMFYIGDYEIELDTIMCYATVPPAISSDCFSETTYDRAILCVPENSLQAYRNADGWEDFWRIVALKESITPGDVNGDSRVTIADVTELIDLLLSETGDTNPVADVDGDGRVTIADVTSLIDYLLNGSW